MASELADAWLGKLGALCDDVRRAARGALCAAVERGSIAELARQSHQGAGDVTYAIDVPAERALDDWLASEARRGPLSLLTEDAGWRHVGPGPRGAVVELSGFDHGGPRIVVDPIDGTRNLMTDLRSAWTVVALAPPGASQPRMSDVVLGVLSEIPDTRGASFRRLSAARGNDGETAPARFELRGVDGARVASERELRADGEAKVDHAYFPFFKYMADLRPAVAEIEARFFERLAAHERADVRNCYDDQYISNGGQLALLALGTYRMIADLRAWLAERRGAPTLTSKPYDIAGAVLCARAAGAVITAVDGSELDFPLDTSTPLSFVGWHNAATRARLERHLAVALGVRQVRPGSP